MPQHQDLESITLNNEGEEIQRIIGDPPGWTLRWGITVVFIAVNIFLVMAWLIKYQDKITDKVLIITENPPIRIYALSAGKIDTLLVHDKQSVGEGQIIARLDNPARWTDVRHLEVTIERLINAGNPTELLRSKLPEKLELGDLQSTYAALQQVARDFRFFENQRNVLQQIASLEQQIQHLESLNQSLRQQEITLTREVEIALSNFNRSQALLKNGSASRLDVENAETNYLQYRRQLEQLQSQVLNNQLNIEQLRARIIEYRQDRTEEGMQKWLAFREILERLKSELESWKQSYLITSPISGKISLTKVWSSQQFVKENEEVAIIVPNKGAGKIIGKAFLPTFNSGKVQIGQPTNIRLDGYPYQEFGSLRGEIRNISLLPDQGNYLLEISLPNNLITTYERPIPFSQELPGQALIVTEDRRILFRLFDQLISLVKNN